MNLPLTDHFLLRICPTDTVCLYPIERRKCKKLYKIYIAATYSPLASTNICIESFRNLQEKRKQYVKVVWFFLGSLKRNNKSEEIFIRGRIF